MAKDQNPPSMNPADEGTLRGVLNILERKMRQRIDNRMPVRVIAYDSAKNRVTVQPLVKRVGTTGEEIDRAQIVSLPVRRMGGGGWHLSFPIKPGDLGYVNSVDVDMANFRQGYKEAAPNTRRTHSFEDGFFVPDKMNDWQHQAEDVDGFVISNEDGSVRLVFDGAEVRITGNVKIDGDLKVTGSIEGMNEIKLESHTHGGVERGGAQTNSPTEGT